MAKHWKLLRPRVSDALGGEAVARESRDLEPIHTDGAGRHDHFVTLRIVAVVAVGVDFVEASVDLLVRQNQLARREKLGDRIVLVYREQPPAWFANVWAGCP